MVDKSPWWSSRKSITDRADSLSFFLYFLSQTGSTELATLVRLSMHSASFISLSANRSKDTKPKQIPSYRHQDRAAPVTDMIRVCRGPGVMESDICPYSLRIRGQCSRIYCETSA